ncbi:hypothetical protein [Streptomyces sp. NPDC002889]|uniref:hypothetical protein n=1 Tax=Streptomyces sp. NPDC002889 TaxID=3364669 RepID=UPI00369AB12B
MSAPHETSQPSGITQAGPDAPAPAEGPQITETECERCGTRIAGMDGRYACGVCGWSNSWTEGHRELPTAEDDPDYPGRTGVPPAAEDGQ